MREAFHVAEANDGGAVLGYQSLDLYSSILPSMSHVAGIGTFISARARGLGIGKALWTANKAFAISAGYRKIVIQVRASNAPALAFYRSLGFAECGRLREQVCIDGLFDDEILLECFLNSRGEVS